LTRHRVIQIHLARLKIIITTEGSPNLFSMQSGSCVRRQTFHLYASLSQLFSFLFRSTRREEGPHIKTNSCRKVLLLVVNGRQQANGATGPCVSGSSGKNTTVAICLTCICI
jgi:hypothetical protein